jgi:NAD(P)-dependent dehydrogenase (short-subunit alcohol dehydrogenase family)
MSEPWTSRDIPSQSGKRIVVTGAANGIGWNTALELARAGAQVTIPARTQRRAEDAVTRIREQTPDARLNIAILDLANLAPIRAFADQQLADRRPIDTLINSAGVMALPKRELSVDGFEMQFATTVLGPFLLTGLLLPLLLDASAPRVITVSSVAHMIGGPVPVKDPNSEREYKPVRAYCKTKLENVLFTRELQQRAGDRLIASACHPGAVHTNLMANTTFGMKSITWLTHPLTQGPEKGCEPTLFAAASPNVKPGLRVAR